MRPSPASTPIETVPASALDWNDVRFFVEVARRGSLSAAARALGVEHATVARRVSALENALGLRLFDRLARSWVLTREGAVLLPQAEQLETQAFALNRAALAVTSRHGPVRVSAPPAFTSHFLAPQLAARAAQWSDLEIELVSEVRSANLHRREADIAIRFMRPHEPGLAARKLGALYFHLHATAPWLARPTAEWRFLGYGEALADVFHQRQLADYASSRPFALRSNDLLALREACRKGLGLAMLPRFLAGTETGLEPVPSPHDLRVQRELWCVLHPDVRRAPRVRQTADLLARIIQESQALLG